jgi:hypothetical protein
MMGRDITLHAPWFETAIGVRALVSIGDGGNEYGMGSAPAAWFAARGVDAPISTCETLVLGQVSNWAALAVLAALSRQTGTALLPSATAYQTLLEQLAARGVVDGVARIARPTEDDWPCGYGMRVVDVLTRWSQSSAR